ncbi:MAG TPA: phosphoribosylglycinamide formyltransferase 2, partial [Flavobacteriaceae bacterium]|nr:phosphoribosylglycinamide formyltransferase 2 [Flavobacteriaceae bacterium]
LPIPEITQEKIGASAVILAPGDSKEPTFEGLEIVSATSKCDFRLFGKPTARPYRRMGVVVTYDSLTSSVSEVTKKARKLADKIEVKL